MIQIISREEAKALFAPKKRHKFNIQRDKLASGRAARTIECRTFHSLREAKRYCELRRMEKLGLLSDLQCQVRIPLVSNGIKVGTYVADFVYRDPARGVVYEDVKGFATREFKLKSRIAAAQGIVIDEV